MSVEVTIVCDECSVIIVAARTAGEARKQGVRHKMMVRRDGKDICRECVERESKRRSPKQETVNTKGQNRYEYDIRRDSTGRPRTAA